MSKCCYSATKSQISQFRFWINITVVSNPPSSTSNWSATFPPNYLFTPAQAFISNSSSGGSLASCALFQPPQSQRWECGSQTLAVSFPVDTTFVGSEDPAVEEVEMHGAIGSCSQTNSCIVGTSTSPPTTGAQLPSSSSFIGSTAFIAVIIAITLALLFFAVVVVAFYYRRLQGGKSSNTFSSPQQTLLASAPPSSQRNASLTIPTSSCSGNGGGGGVGEGGTKGDGKQLFSHTQPTLSQQTSPQKSSSQPSHTPPALGRLAGGPTIMDIAFSQQQRMTAKTLNSFPASSSTTRFSSSTANITTDHLRGEGEGEHGGGGVGTSTTISKKLKKAAEGRQGRRGERQQQPKHRAPTLLELKDARDVKNKEAISRFI